VETSFFEKTLFWGAADTFFAFKRGGNFSHNFWGPKPLLRFVEQSVFYTHKQAESVVAPPLDFSL